MTRHHNEPPQGYAASFKGPRCWVLSALVGLFLGLGLSSVAPRGSTIHASHDAGHELPRVCESLPDGTRLERLPDGTTRAWSDRVDLSGAAQAAGEDAGTVDTHQRSDSTMTPLSNGEALRDARVNADSTGGTPVPLKREASSNSTGGTPVPLKGEASSNSTGGTPVPLKGEASRDAHATPDIPLWLCAPFSLLLGSIALMPFINAKFWAAHFPDFAFGLGAFVAGYYLGAFGGYGRHAILHSLIEYYSFIALVGGLFVVSGGIMIDVRSRATPFANTALLAFGAVLANLVGTTGASMLLIRPFMRMNNGRLRPIHVVMFIFIISNCAGCLTPIGDPPLYLGFLKGVPFMWTITHLWPMWLVCVGALLVLFFFMDARITRRTSTLPDTNDAKATLRSDALTSDATDDTISGTRTIRLGPITLQGIPALGFLVLMVLGVFIDPLLKKYAGIEGLPIGATFQVIVAIAAYFTADEGIHNANSFDFHPVEEVGFLFAGIFLTMVPALGYLAANASNLGLESPTQYYFFTGGLSAVLDNAPTYLNFMQSGLGVLHLPMDSGGINRFIVNTYDVIHGDGAIVHFKGQTLLEAISLGAVFFGAMTYIGNGPNFMVKSIAEAQGVKMPSFFAYLGLSCVILLPVLILVWAIFVR